MSPERRPAVDDELRRLEATVEGAFGGSIDLDRARTSDPQGIGGPAAAPDAPDATARRQHATGSSGRLGHPGPPGHPRLSTAAGCRSDALAGLTVWALLVPQALAYAQLGGFDAVVGLYAAIGALLGYALMGGVREMSVGPEATIALLTASIIAPLAEGDPSRYLALGAGVALMAGILLMLAGIARLGFVTRYLSRPLLVGYVAGSAIVMIVSQLDSLIGITLVAQDDTLAELTETIRRIGETDPLTLAVGLGVIAIVLVVKRLDQRLPAYLVGVLRGDRRERRPRPRGAGGQGRGRSIPPGLPPLGLPADRPRATSSCCSCRRPPSGCSIYADSGVTGQVLGRRGGYRVDGDGEFLGLGAANIGASLTGGFPVNGSQSRSFTAADMGARSQLAGIVAVALVVVTLLFLTPLFAPAAQGRARGRDHRGRRGPARPGGVPAAGRGRPLGGRAGGPGHRHRGRGRDARRACWSSRCSRCCSWRSEPPALGATFLVQVPGHGQLSGRRFRPRRPPGAGHGALPLRRPAVLRQRRRVPRRRDRMPSRPPTRRRGGSSWTWRASRTPTPRDPDARRAAGGPRRPGRHRRVRAPQGRRSRPTSTVPVSAPPPTPGASSSRSTTRSPPSGRTRPPRTERTGPGST